MNREIESIIADFRAITAEAVESGEGIEQIYTLCHEVEGLDDPPEAFPAFFELMERLPNSDLGSPGELVHTMEQYTGSYEDLLEHSIRSLPTYLTVWMINRIMNVPSADRDRWLPLLRSVETHPAATEGIKSEARMFLERQETI
jgi:hypothetical protein